MSVWHCNEEPLRDSNPQYAVAKRKPHLYLSDVLLARRMIRTYRFFLHRRAEDAGYEALTRSPIWNGTR